MDLDQILQSYLNSPSGETDCDLSASESSNQLISKQSISPSDAFCSDEDIVKSFFPENNESEDQICTTQFFISSMDSGKSFLENQVYLSDELRFFNCLFTDKDLSSTSIASNEAQSGALDLRSKYHDKINDVYLAVKTNFMLLVKNGFKLTLSLNIDNSEIDEGWNPSICQKILSAEVSSLNLRAEFLGDEANSDQFESCLLAEICATFDNRKYFNLFIDLNDKSKAKPTPNQLISIFNGINDNTKTNKTYKQIKIEGYDKIILLTNVFYALHLMEGIINYDTTIDGWNFPESGFKYDRRDTFLFDSTLHDGAVNVIETFPDEWRNDHKVIALIYSIMIFDPDLPDLMKPEAVKHRQFTYIHLLRWYLTSICESECKAVDNLYRLLVKIEQIKVLSSKFKTKFDALYEGSLFGIILKSI